MDAANENAGANAAPAAAGDAAAPKYFGRFHVELIPGQMNIVSLKKLVREADKEAVVSDDSSDETESDYYIQVRKPRIKKSGSLVIRDKVQHKTGKNKSSTSSNNQPQKKRKEIMDSVQVDTKRNKKGNQLIMTAAGTAISIDRNPKSQVFNVLNDRCKGDFQNLLKSSGGVPLKKHSDSSSRLDCLPLAKKFQGDASGAAKTVRNDKMGFVTDPRDPGNNIISSSTSAAHHKIQEKKSTQHDLHSRSLMSKNIEREGFTNIRHQSKKERNELPDLNLPYTGKALRTASVHITDAPEIGEKMLDWSIFQLEKLVENSKTPLIDVQGADASSLDIQKQLSPELKEKLSKVARLTQINEGKISEELIDRLMTILGKFLQRKTLKKILRETVLEDLFAGKAECNNFKQIRKDIVEMIRLQAPSLNAKVFPACRVSKGIYSMGDQLEDKLNDLYETFTQGLDEDIGPPLVRKLYVKLAELWPKGAIDNHEIREAICRARERKLALSSEEKLIHKHNSSGISFPVEKVHQTTKINKLSARTGETIRGKACSVTQTPAAYNNVITDTSGLAQTSGNRRMVSSMPTVGLPPRAPSSMSKIPPKSLYRNMV